MDDLFPARPLREPARSLRFWLPCIVLALLSSSFWRAPGEVDPIGLAFPVWADLAVAFSCLLGLLIAGALRWQWQLPRDHTAPSASSPRPVVTTPGCGRSSWLPPWAARESRS